jgi:hypothetical protein
VSDPFHQLEDALMPPLTGKEIETLLKANGVDFVMDLIQRRNKMVLASRTDPLNYGFELECWKEARTQMDESDELLILGGNRAGKTEFAAKKAVEILMARENAVVWCLHSSLPSSIELQQPVIRRYLPPEWRSMGKKGQVANVSFTVKNGFSEQVFVLPNGGRCRFLNYTQDIKVLEGGECDLIWCDELVPLNWLETLRFRIVTRQGKLLITFTPVKGYSMTVKDYVAGAKVLKERPSELLPDTVNVQGCELGTMPYVLQPFRKNARVVSFFSEDNPYGGYENIKKMLDGKPSPEIKIRAYGWAEKLEGNTFPKFDEKIHVVPPEKIPKTGTRYCSCDPAGLKNWFIKWYLLDDLGRVFLYREWPDRRIYGEWALPSEKPDGTPGPAQTNDQGRSIVGYKKLVLELEGWKWDEVEGEWRDRGAEQIAERFIDPRMGGAVVPSQEEGTSIISLMENEQRDREGNLVGPSMVWQRADGGSIDEGIQMINDHMDYDNGKEVTAMNAPRYYVSSDCEQSIFSYHEYTGRDGLKGAMKDVIDPDRYFLKSGPVYYDEKVALFTEGGSY